MCLKYVRVKYIWLHYVTFLSHILINFEIKLDLGETQLQNENLTHFLTRMA